MTNLLTAIAAVGAAWALSILVRWADAERHHIDDLNDYR